MCLAFFFFARARGSALTPITHAPRSWFFCNWYGRLDVAAAWLPLLQSALAQRAPTSAQLDALFAGNAARAYRVQL